MKKDCQIDFAYICPPQWIKFELGLLRIMRLHLSLP